MVYAGAKGETAEQMARRFRSIRAWQAPHCTTAAGQLIRELNAGGTQRVSATVANRLWGQKDFKFLDHF